MNNVTIAPTTIAQVMRSLRTAIIADPSYAWSWQCNLAMCFMDAMPEKGWRSHRIANEGAAAFMSLLFGIDVTKSDQWAALDRQWTQSEAQDKPRPSFQQRVRMWVKECFGSEIADDKPERNHRFLEEALELVQSLGCTSDEAHQLVDYVYGRPWGEPAQEVGGVMVTLAALCGANELDMEKAAETELFRIWTKIPQIRAKQAAKPKHSPLPQ